MPDGACRTYAATWNRQALLNGERPEINAETLPRHLNAMPARTRLSPSAEPFAVLLSALRCDSKTWTLSRAIREQFHNQTSVRMLSRMIGETRRTPQAGRH